MNSQDDKEGSGHVKAAMIGGVFALLAACVGGFFLILNTMINNGVIVFGMSNPSTPPTATASQYQEPVIAPTQSESSIAQPTTILQPTAKPITGDCQETSPQSLSSLPSAPSSGCVLIVEWWIPPDASNCGILITASTPDIPNNATGTWWNVYPTRPESHVQEFLQKNPSCKVEDKR